MTPYKLIKGSDKNITAFEEQISNALLDGYDLANDLVVQIITSPTGDTETLLFQSLICDEALELEDEEDDEDDEFDDEEIDEYEEEEEELS